MPNDDEIERTRLVAAKAVEAHKRAQQAEQDRLDERDEAVRAHIAAHLRAGEDPPPWSSIGPSIGLGASTVRGVGRDTVAAHRARAKRRKG